MSNTSRESDASDDGKTSSHNVEDSPSENGSDSSFDPHASVIASEIEELDEEEEEEEEEIEDEQDGENEKEGEDDDDEIGNRSENVEECVQGKEDKLIPYEVQQFVKIGVLVPKEPPTYRKCTAKAWTEGGMRFLYWAENEAELENWYYCTICEWAHEVVLGGGTNVIKSHAEKHFYQLKKGEMVDLLVKATSFGEKYGSVSALTFSDHLPTSDLW